MRPEWKKLSILWPQSGSFPAAIPRNGDEAHRLAAALVAGSEDDPRCAVPAELFHHTQDTAGRRTLSGLSPIRFSANPKGMQITAVGDEAVDLLAASGHRLTRVFSRAARQPLREEWHGGHLGCKAMRTPVRYRIPSYVFTRLPAKRTPHAEAISNKQLTPGLGSWLEGRIVSGILRQCALVGLPEPDVEPLVRVVGVDRIQGMTREEHFSGLVARGLVFEADVVLDGPWSVGHFCLLGYGAVLRHRRLIASGPVVR